jgi:hypothetical protein
VTETSKIFNRSDFQRDFGRTSPRFQLAAAAAQYAEILRRSPWAQDKRMDDVKWLAIAVQKQLPFDQDVNEFAGLVDRAASLYR